MSSNVESNRFYHPNSNVSVGYEFIEMAKYASLNKCKNTKFYFVSFCLTTARSFAILSKIKFGNEVIIPNIKLNPG